VASQETGTQDRLLLLDGHSLAYRAFFALPIENFSTTTGQPTNAVYGFTAMLINVLRDEKPTHVAVAFDRGEPTFRHEQWVEYKANRRETPDDFRSQLSLIFEVLDALGVRRLSAPGYEADDLIATLATQAAAEGMDVLIVTGDRDVLQLVSDRVTALMTRRGITEMTRFTPATVTEKYGLTPAQYPDFAALRGDPSDNLPGIPGVGEKTATKWIAEFGSLQALVDRVDEVKGKAGDALREHLGSVLRNRQLTSLVTDLPAETVGAVPGDLLPVAWDREKIHQLFDTLQFKVLRERLYQTLPHGLIGATGSDPDDPLAAAAIAVNAIRAAGARACLIQSDASPADIAARLNACGARVLITSAPLAELAARERSVERAVELLRLKRFAKELEPMLCGEAYLIVAPRDHDDWKSKVFRMTSKRRAVLSRRYGIEDDRVNPVMSPQEIAH